MLIFADGLLGGERLALCSDEAQLHFPRIAALANGFGRFELNLRTIREMAYKGFTTPPGKESIAAWLKEYASRHLLFVYRTESGVPWGQWRGVTSNMLPRFKTAADKRSPEPPAQQLEAYDSAYHRQKDDSGDFLSMTEHFGNVPKTSEGFGTVPNLPAGEVRCGEVVGEVVGEERRKACAANAPGDPTSPKAHTARSNAQSGDPRHVPFKDQFFAYFKSNNGGHAPPWAGKEAKHLGEWLKSRPSTTPEEWETILRNRGASVVNHGEPLSQWVANATRYLSGALDKFGQVVTTQEHQPQRVSALDKVLGKGGYVQ